MPQPFLTTVIPVYNGERYLSATLDSVAKQTRPPDRLVILDNCSTDRTEELVKSHPTLKVEWRRNETNIGLLSNLNRALEFASETDYLHLLMADDLVLPTFCERLVASMDSIQGRALGYSFNETIDSKGVQVGPAKRRPSLPPRKLSLNEYLTPQSELNTVLLPAVVFKTNRQPAPCFFQDLPQVADTLLLGEWAAHCRNIVEVSEYLCQYRLHPFNTTSSNIKSLQFWVLDEWRVMQAISKLIDEPAFNHWVRSQKLKGLFAARSHVKVRFMKKEQPDFARLIKQAAVERVGSFYWTAGSIVLFARDLLWRFSGTKHLMENAVK